jgi:hypothetical protein
VLKTKLKDFMASTPHQLISSQELAAFFQSHSLFSSIPTPRSRNSEQLDAALRGKIAILVSALQSSMPESKKRIIRFFVSSTFTDTFHERAVLLQSVLPFVRVRSYCDCFDTSRQPLLGIFSKFSPFLFMFRTLAALSTLKYS